jgi:hypothetical protein
MGTEGSCFPGAKARLGRDADHSPPSSTEVKNVYELSLSSPFSPAWRNGTALLYFSPTENEIIFNIIEIILYFKLIYKTFSFIFFGTLMENK